MERAVVALSGGVDSAVAAALLVEQGVELTGVMLRLWSEPEGAGYAAGAVERARTLADRLGFPFHLVDVRDAFRRAVVEPFVAEYAAAHTPNPCVLCNRDLRFDFMLAWAGQHGIEWLATGHYARVRQVDGLFQLLRARDRAKDQAYVLHVLTQAQLARVRFPLGELTKAEVRALARQWELPASDQLDSQDACFLGGGDYRQFLAEHAPQVLQPGPIVDPAGRVLGHHAGLVNYTIGQRKGIGVAAREPLYVVELRPEENALVVGPAEALGWDECSVGHMHYVAGRTPQAPFTANAQIRYRHRQVDVTATPLPERRLAVRFARTQRDVAPGQYLVLYDGDVVLGGGVIERS